MTACGLRVHENEGPQRVRQRSPTVSLSVAGRTFRRRRGASRADARPPARGRRHARQQLVAERGGNAPARLTRIAAAGHRAGVAGAAKRADARRQRILGRGQRELRRCSWQWREPRDHQVIGVAQPHFLEAAALVEGDRRVLRMNGERHLLAPGRRAPPRARPASAAGHGPAGESARTAQCRAAASRCRRRPGRRPAA